jgi:hypothetical protein
MHFPLTLLVLAAVAPLANAFPATVFERAANDPKFLASSEKLANTLDKRQAGADAATLLFEPIPTFDGEKQYINVSKGSGHEWVAPGPNDLRGPCPGLNAFANHSRYTENKSRRIN